MFTLNSSSDSLGTESFGFTRQNGTRPRPGRYPLELVGPHNQDGDRFYAGYHRVKDGRYEDYVATTGWIEITRSSDDRVEGTFYLVGKQYCAGPVIDYDPKPCAMPWAAPADAPEVAVTGSFSAIPDDLTADW